MPLRMTKEDRKVREDEQRRKRLGRRKRMGPGIGAPGREPRSPKPKLKQQSERRNENNFIPNPYLTGGQAKLDKNKNNKIDAQDFKILRAEKAKGRGQGLQDEKMKPGKPMKAALGAIALGLGAKKMKEKGKMMPMGIGAAAAVNKKKKEILGKKRGGQMKKDPTKPVNPFAKKGLTPNKRAQFLKKMGRAAGVGARLGVAGAALGAVGAGAAMLGRKIGKKLDEAKKKKAKGKMGGGMMQRPGYSVGGSVTVKTKLGRNRPTKMY
jgi:hypothetical protein